MPILITFSINVHTNETEFGRLSVDLISTVLSFKSSQLGCSTVHTLNCCELEFVLRKHLSECLGMLCAAFVL